MEVFRDPPETAGVGKGYLIPEALFEFLDGVAGKKRQEMLFQVAQDSHRCGNRRRLASLLQPEDNLAALRGQGVQLLAHLG